MTKEITEKKNKKMKLIRADDIQPDIDRKMKALDLLVILHQL